MTSSKPIQLSMVRVLYVLSLYFSYNYAFAQQQIKGDLSYGFIDPESGLLVVRTDEAFYTIGASDDSFNRIRTRDMEKDSISYFRGTPYMKILTPGLVIVDKMTNQVVFDQSQHTFSRLHHVSMLPELDAFFLVASERKSPRTKKKEKGKGFLKNISDGVKNGLSSESKKTKKELRRFGRSDSISFNLVHIQSGEVLWKYVPDANQAKFFTAPTDKPRLLSANKVVFPFGDNFYCLDAQLGTLLWKYPYQRPGLFSSLKNFFSAQQNSGYYVNQTKEPSLLIFENYKKRKQDRVKELTMVNSDGKVEWKVPLNKEEYIQSFWKENVLISATKTARLMDLKSGKNRWGSIYNTDEERLRVYVGTNFFLFEEQKNSSRRYPMSLTALDPSTGKPTWSSPKQYKSQKENVRFRANGILSYDKEDKELSFFNYETGNPIWEYPQNSLYSYNALGSEYYMLTKAGVERLDESGNKIWDDVIPMKKQRSLWNVFEEGENKVIVTARESGASDKQMTYVSSTGDVLFEKKNWKVGSLESLIFKKIINDELYYLTNSGFFKTSLKSDEKTQQLAKFSKGFTRVLSYDNSLMGIKSGDNYYYLDLETGEFDQLVKNLKFKGKNEQRQMSFIGRKGLLIQNQENVAFVTLAGELKYNKYYKYPEKSLIGLKVLQAALNVATFVYQVDQLGEYSEDAGEYYESGDRKFANNAIGHANNFRLAGLANSVINNRINAFTTASENRKKMAANARPVAVFAVRRMYGNKKEVVLVNLDPETGEELSEQLLGEKSPIFYVDEVGRLVYFIDKNQFITKMKI